MAESWVIFFIISVDHALCNIADVENFILNYMVCFRRTISDKENVYNSNNAMQSCETVSEIAYYTKNGEISRIKVNLQESSVSKAFQIRFL